MKDYGIGEVAEMSSVTQKQLRYWEDKNYIPRPLKIICGQRHYRRYSEELVTLICLMKELIDGGMTVSASAKEAQRIISEGGGKIA